MQCHCGINPHAAWKCGRRGGRPSRGFASNRASRIDYLLEGYRLDVRCWCAGVGTMPLQCSRLPACCACVATGFTPGFVYSGDGNQKSRDKPARYDRFATCRFTRQRKTTRMPLLLSSDSTPQHSLTFFSCPKGTHFNHRYGANRSDSPSLR